MKKIIVLLAFLPLVAIAQESADTLSFHYEGVENVDSVASKTLMSRTRLFVAEQFKSVKDVIQLDDPEAGVIVVKGLIVPYVKQALAGTFEYGVVHFTMKIQVKDGKYKYTLSDFDHESHGQNQCSGGVLTSAKPGCSTFLLSKGYWRQIKIYTDKKMVDFVAALKVKMHSQDVSKKDDF